MSKEILRISKDSQFYIQGSLVSTKDVVNLNDYLTQMLGLYTTLDEGITLSELIHAFYGLREFIGNYFSEEYEVARAFATSTKLDSKFSKIKLYKSFRVESDDFLDDDEYIYILPEIKFLEPTENEIGSFKIGDLVVEIDETVIYNGEDFSFKKKSKFTLLDILSCVFDEIVEVVKDGRSIGNN